MPKTLLAFIVVAVIGLGAMTWHQFFLEPGATPPVIDTGSTGKPPTGLPDQEEDEPGTGIPASVDVPLDVRVETAMQKLFLVVLGREQLTARREMDWLYDTEEGVAELRRVLEHSKDDNVRAAALLSLGLCSIEGTVVTLVEAVDGRYGDQLRTAGLVGMIDSLEEVNPTLRRVFLDTRDEGLAAASLQVLVNRDSLQALETFAFLLGKTPQLDRRTALYESLAGTPLPVETVEPEIMARIRGQFGGLPLPEPDPDPEKSRAIKDIVDQIVHEDDPRFQEVVTRVLARLPGKATEDAFLERYRAADDDQKLGLLSLVNPELSRGKIRRFCRMAPSMTDRRHRELLAFQAAASMDMRIVGELRIWRDLEADEAIRAQLVETIRRFEGR